MRRSQTRVNRKVALGDEQKRLHRDYLEIQIGQKEQETKRQKTKDKPNENTSKYKDVQTQINIYGIDCDTNLSLLSRTIMRLFVLLPENRVSVSILFDPRRSQLYPSQSTIIHLCN